MRPVITVAGAAGSYEKLWYVCVPGDCVIGMPSFGLAGAAGAHAAGAAHVGAQPPQPLAWACPANATELAIANTVVARDLHMIETFQKADPGDGRATIPRVGQR